MDQPALLEMRNICKSFPGVKALDNVSLTVRPGTVHALSLIHICQQVHAGNRDVGFGQHHLPDHRP